MLFFFELCQSVVDRRERVLDLFALGVRRVDDPGRLCALLFVHFRSGDLFEEHESVVVFLVCEVRDAPLRDDVVRVAPAEACALEQAHDLALADRLAVELVLVFLLSDGPSEQHCRLACVLARFSMRLSAASKVRKRTGREAAVCVVKFDLDESAHGLTAQAASSGRSVVQEGLPLLARHVGVRVGQDEPDRAEKVGLARTIATDEHVQVRTERVDDRLVPVRLEALDL